MSEFGFQAKPGNGPAARREGISDPSMSPQRNPWGRPIKTDDNQRQDTRTSNNDRTDNQVDNNDDGINDADIDTIWEDVKKKKGDDDIDPPPNNRNDPPPDPKKQIDEYLVTIGLEPLVVTDAEKEEMKQGNFDNVFAKMNDKIRTAHLKAMSGSKTMIDNAVKEAVQQAMAGANSTFEGRINLQALHNALPFTKDKAIDPVAQSVMQKFLKRGMSTEDAIDGTRRYFAKVSDAYAGSTVNKNRNTGFGGRGPSAEETAPEGGWLKVLRGEGNS